VSLTRRKFLKTTGLIGAALATDPRRILAHAARVQTSINPDSLAKFVDPLPIPAVARSVKTRPSPFNASFKVPYHRIEMREIEAKVHRDLKPTRMWGYAGSSPGPTIETRRGQGLMVEWVNALPQKHLLPIDHRIHGAGTDRPDVRTVTHLHGAKAPADSDGYPDDWYAPGKSAVYFYPNDQDAATLWYHDHAIGITRLNIFAGLFGAYVIRDEFEDSLHLPAGEYEIPLLMYDRSFDVNGQLAYSISGLPPDEWIPEFFGDVILVNGKIFPYLEIEPRAYRFRLVNVANSRFFHLSLSNQQTFHQIGTDLGLLPAPIPLKTLMVAPAERVDLVIDFSGRRGEQIVLRNDTIEVMQFRVAGSAGASYSLPAKLRPVPRTPEARRSRPGCSPWTNTTIARATPC
jgi:spore coat protein A